MTDSDSPIFAAELALLAEVFEKQLSPARLRAYFEALEDFDLAEVRQACRGFIRARFFPLPVELIDAIRATRRALRVEAQQALPEPKAITDEERREIEQAMAQFQAVVSRDVFRQFQPRTFPEVSPAEQEAHERRRREAAARFLSSGQNP